MYYFAFSVLAAIMNIALIDIFWIANTLWPWHKLNNKFILIIKNKYPNQSSKKVSLALVEITSISITVLLSIASGILTYALASYNFSLQYVASYTDQFLPLFYRITAFWAGQAGSMLFWALSTSIASCIFQHTYLYKKLSIDTKLWFWILYLSIMAFFGLLLITWNNPFILLDIKPIDGNGLNPLLQNPGMIFHPPLLFLGYGWFTIPGCLALAQTISNKKTEEPSWILVSKPFILSAWAFLTAGIVLGGWWAYMELGWGGYWAWDPVENASLIPWLISTAALHTLIIQTRKNVLTHINVLLMALTTLSTFFATYLVRSGIVQSVHAFGTSNVGKPLLIFITFATIIIISIFYTAYSTKDDSELSTINSRVGFLIFTSWLLLALAILILLATMWPVFTSFWNQIVLGQPILQSSTSINQEPAGSIGLTSDFYNKTCLPLFAILMALLSLCPWLGWTKGIHNLKNIILVLITFFASSCIMYLSGYQLPIAILGASSAFAIMTSTVLLILDKQIRSNKPTLLAYGIHFGVALIAMGIAFSGPYKIEIEPILHEGETIKVGNFDIKLIKIQEGELVDYAYIEGLLEVRKDGKFIDFIAPQRRIYKKWGKMQFAEADTIPSLGNELYASLLAVDHQNRALFRLSSMPLVNWIWIGGAIISLLPFFSIISSYRGKNYASSANSYQQSI